MLFTNARQIKTYSQCPRKAFLSWKQEPVQSLDVRIISDVIKQIYMYHARKGKIVSWRFVFKWTERRLTQELSFASQNEEYKEVKECLTRISYWYNKHYLDNYADIGLVNLPMAVGLGSKFTLRDSIDLVIISKQGVKLVDFVNVPHSKVINQIDIFNDLEAQVKAWLFWKAAEEFPVEYVRMVIKPQTIYPVKIMLTKKGLNYIERLIKHIGSGMSHDIFYASFSEQCNYCPFNNCYL
jgi:hypothetical protein